MVPAGFTQRALGRAIDLAILTLLIVLALTPFNEGDSLDAPPLFLVAVLVAVLAYEIVPVYLRGQTPGKLIARTRIVRADALDAPEAVTGLTLTWWQAFVRWAPVCVVWALGGVYPPLAVVAMAALYLSALADVGGRSVLDKLAGTRVVRSVVTAPPA
jgi:uncharacterized RDD family membrane protein YckC